MTLFKTATHQEVWQDRWCHSCFQPDEARRRLQGSDTICPIWERAVRTNRKPPQWDRTRADEMEKSIRCNEYAPRPPRTGRGIAVLDEPGMFDVEAAEPRYIPVEGLPTTRTGSVDHA